jgi:hypothetical protein
MDVLVERGMFAADAADTMRALLERLDDDGYVLEKLDPGPQPYPPAGDLYAWLRDERHKFSSSRGSDRMFT